MEIIIFQKIPLGRRQRESMKQAIVTTRMNTVLYMEAWLRLR